MNGSLFPTKTLAVTLALLAAACAPSIRAPEPAPPAYPAPANAPTTPQTPLPTPPIATPPAPAARSGSWSFNLTPGSYSYFISSAGTIASLPDTSTRQSLPPSNARVTISVAQNGDTQVTDPATPAQSACDAAATVILRAQLLVPKLPAHMSAGDTWTDTTMTNGCRGSVPATSTMIRTFTVIGDTTLNGAQALQIHRSDVISATGEGANGQHRVLVSATGTGSTELYVDTSAGRLLGSVANQSTTVAITTSGKTSHFLQHVTEQVRSTP